MFIRDLIYHCVTKLIFQWPEDLDFYHQSLSNRCPGRITIIYNGYLTTVGIIGIGIIQTRVVIIDGVVGNMYCVVYCS